MEAFMVDELEDKRPPHKIPNGTKVADAYDVSKGNGHESAGWLVVRWAHHDRYLNPSPIDKSR